MTRQDNRLWSPWQPDSSTVCLAFFHLKMKPEAKKSWKCNQQINWYKKKRKKKGTKRQVRLQAIKITVWVCLSHIHTHTDIHTPTRYFKILLDKHATIMLYFFQMPHLFLKSQNNSFFFLSSFKVTRQCNRWSFLYCVCTGISKFLSSLVPISELSRDQGLMCNSFIWGLNERGKQGQKGDQGWEIRGQFCLPTWGYHILLPLDLLSNRSCSSVELKESCSSFVIFSFLNRRRFLKLHLAHCLFCPCNFLLFTDLKNPVAQLSF